jgi:hypothetical protein
MPDFIEQLRFRLLERGCPVGRMKRTIREVADHRRDLTEAAIEKGMAAPLAQEWASAKLGNPEVLAEDLMVSWQRSRWCWRHAFITFGLAPLLLFPVFWVLSLLLCLSTEFAIGFCWDHNILQTANHPAMFGYLAKVAHGADYAAIALVVFLFCLLGRRSAVNLKWVMLAGLICAVYSLFTYTHVVPHSFSIGFSWKLQWIRAAIPLLVVGMAYGNRRRLVRNALKTAAA